MVLRTLDIRLEKHQENTMKVIKWMNLNKKKLQKFYILINHQLLLINCGKNTIPALRVCLAIIVKSKSKSSVYKFINSLELFGIGYSWGGY